MLSVLVEAALLLPAASCARTRGSRRDHRAAALIPLTETVYVAPAPVMTAGVRHRSREVTSAVEAGHRLPEDHRESIGEALVGSACPRPG